MALVDLEFDVMLPVQALAGSFGAVTAEQRRQVDKTLPSNQFGVSSRKLHADGTLVKNLFTGIDVQRVYPHRVPRGQEGFYTPEDETDNPLFDDLVNACSDFEWLGMTVTSEGVEPYAFDASLTPLVHKGGSPYQTLDNGFVRIEFSLYASMMGRDALSIGGMQFDPEGGGNYGNRDFSSPGSPFEHWAVVVRGWLIGSVWGAHLSDWQYYSNDADIVAATCHHSSSETDIVLGFYLPAGSKSLYMRMGVFHRPTIFLGDTSSAGTHAYLNRFIDPDQGRTYDHTPAYDTGGDYSTFNTLTNRSSAMAYEPVSGWTLEIRGCAVYPEGAIRPRVRLDWDEDPSIVFEEPSDDAYYTDSSINAVAKIPFDDGSAVYDLVYSFYAMTPDMALES